MTQKSSGPRKPGGGKIDKEERDRIIAKAKKGIGSLPRHVKSGLNGNKAIESSP
jgi:hypothetical protein